MKIREDLHWRLLAYRIQHKLPNLNVAILKLLEIGEAEQDGKQERIRALSSENCIY